MRCPECGRLMNVSYISDTDPKHRVYQCSTAGVPQYVRTKSGSTKQIGSTSDHSDLYFVQMTPYGTPTRVKPVNLGKDKRKGLDGKPETFHRWAFQPVTVAKRREVTTA